MKQWRKWMAAGLTAIMAVSTAACGSTGGTESASSGEEQTNFSIFAGISALSPDNSEKPLVQQMNEAMGVTIEWNCVSGDTLTEKKNLILNAISFSEPNSKIDIFVCRDEKNIYIKITNYGKSIKKEEVKHVFDKYYTTTKKFRKVGTGLGLYLSDKIVKAHKGRINVESEEGVSTTFSIVLPS